MKIGIFGSYGGGSTGDEAILLGLLTTINEVVKSNEIFVETVYVYTENRIVTSKALDHAKFSFELEYVLFNSQKEEQKDYEKSLLVNKGESKTSFKVKTYRTLSKKLPETTLKLEKTLRKIIRKPLMDFKINNNLDLLIIGGGNLLMDMFNRWPIKLNYIVNQAKINKIPVAFLGMGAGPIELKSSKKIFKKMLKDSYVSTRDVESAEYLRKTIDFNTAIVGTDLAFGLSEDVVDEDNKQGIGATIVPYLASYFWPDFDTPKFEVYCKNVARLFDSIIEKTNEDVYFFATNFPPDVHFANDVVEFMNNKNRVFIDNRRLNVSEILSICKSRKFIVGTRLHSLILSTCVNTDIFAISYQPKVNNFLNRIGRGYDFIDIDRLVTSLSDQEISSMSDQILERFTDNQETPFRQEYKQKLIYEMKNILESVKGDI